MACGILRFLWSFRAPGYNILKEILTSWSGPWLRQVPKSRRAAAPVMSEASKRMPTYEKKEPGEWLGIIWAAGT